MTCTAVAEFRMWAQWPFGNKKLFFFHHVEKKKLRLRLRLVMKAGKKKPRGTSYKHLEVSQHKQGKMFPIEMDMSK